MVIIHLPKSYLFLNDSNCVHTVFPLLDNRLHSQLYQICSVPMINTMLHKTVTIQLTNPYLAICDDEQFYTCPVDVDIMKCLVSGGPYPVNGNNNCYLALHCDRYKNSGIFGKESE